MADGYDYTRHGGDFPTLRDDEVELLCAALATYSAVMAQDPAGMPRLHVDAYSSLFLKASNAAAQRRIGPYRS